MGNTLSLSPFCFLPSPTMFWSYLKIYGERGKTECALIATLLSMQVFEAAGTPEE